MNNGTFTDYAVHKLLTLCIPSWVSLHFDSPLISGATASEFQGTGYTRAYTSFTDPSNRTMWGTQDLRWHGLAAGVITWVGGWDAQAGGNLLWASQLTQPVRVAEGGGWSVTTGDLALSVG